MRRGLNSDAFGVKLFPVDAVTFVIGGLLAAIAVPRLIAKFGPLLWAFPRLIRVRQVGYLKMLELRRLLGQSL